MAHEFRLPDIGEGLAEADVVRWHVSVGDHIAADQIVVEVETAKAIVELPSPYAGVVLRLGAAEGETMDVGTVLLVVGDEGEQLPDGERPGTEAAPEPARDAPAPIVGTLSEEADDLTPPTNPTVGGQRVRALPLVRKMAREKGIDLAGIVGTGPNGAITRSDVESAASLNTQVGSPPMPRDGGEQDRRPLSRLRKTIASNMSRSWEEIPHVTTFDTVDAGRLMAVRSALTGRHDRPIPVDALICRAVIPALESFPEFNASLDGDDLVLHRRVDLGIAVDTPDGLMVAVLVAAESKSLLELADEIARLGKGAKERRLNPDELAGQTFTVSNIGAVGGGWGTPIIPHGTTAILSVGRAAPAPAVRNGAIEVGTMMPLSLSYDHRVIDGGQGRRFMTLVMENIEEPALFLA